MILKIKTKLQEFQIWLMDTPFPMWTVPVALFFVCVISFAFYIPSMGFYWDDWETILVARLYPVSEFWSYFSSNRPLAAWTYIVLTPLLGAGKTGWHLFSLFMRWGAILAMWWVFAQVWNRNGRQVIYALFLFSIYPVFFQQPIAVSYHQHWMGYALYFISLGLMVSAIRNPRFRVLKTVLALAATLLHLMIFEYFVGAELLRPVILWILIAREENGFLKRIGTMIKRWLPYLLVLLLFSGWRLLYSAQAEFDTNRPVLVFDFFHHPLGVIRLVTDMALKDTIYVLFTSWYKTFQPDLFDLFDVQSLVIWVVIILSTILLSIYLSGLKCDEAENKVDERRWNLEATVVGLCAIILGLIPVWVTERLAFAEGQNADRFALVTMFGASLIVTAFLQLLIENRIKFIVVLSILVSLSMGLNLRIGSDYQNSWRVQTDLYWQLYWRAPYIEPHTTFLSHGQLFPYVMPSFSFNLLYLEPERPQDTSYWFYLLERQFQQDSGNWLEGKEISENYREFSYHASTLDSLVLSKGHGNCLWIVDEKDSENPQLSGLELEALPLSDLDRIIAEPSSDEYPTPEIFGNEPEHGWCYYYQKAELARQYGNWPVIIELADEAKSKGFVINNQGSDSPHEWMPFIEAYANTENWNEAVGLTVSILEKDDRYRDALNKLWHRIADEVPASPGMDEAFENVINRLTETQ